MADQQNVRRKSDGTAEHQQVAKTHRQVALQAKQRQSNRCEANPDDSAATRRPAQEQGLAQGNQYYREPGDKAGLGGCRQAQAKGLKCVAGKQRQTDDNPWKETSLTDPIRV